jgi:hypothetical protein
MGKNASFIGLMEEYSNLKWIISLAEECRFFSILS